MASCDRAEPAVRAADAPGCSRPIAGLRLAARRRPAGTASGTSPSSQYGPRSHPSASPPIHSLSRTSGQNSSRWPVSPSAWIRSCRFSQPAGRTARAAAARTAALRGDHSERDAWASDTQRNRTSYCRNRLVGRHERHVLDTRLRDQRPHSSENTGAFSNRSRRSSGQRVVKIIRDDDSPFSASARRRGAAETEGRWRPAAQRDARSWR